MPRTSFPRRSSGVLLPISALPSSGPIGDFGPAAFAFIDWLAAAGQHYWQILPLLLPDSHGSPYASPSGMAGNWMLISQTKLIEAGLLPPKDFFDGRIAEQVVYRQVARIKWQMIRRSWHHLQAYGTARQHREFIFWRRENADWLLDYTLYQAVKDRHQHQPWWTWQKKWRDPVSARKNLDAGLRRQMDLHAYAQWVFQRQWDQVHRYAKKHRVDIIGDLPFYVQDDSVEVWSQPKLFKLTPSGRPKVVAGVPADVFSRTGQRWGNPVYDWPHHRRQKFSWWQGRVGRLSQWVDVIRFDHFQGFAETFHVSSKARDGQRGQWDKTPGHELLPAILRRVPKLRGVAEDIGHPEPNAEQLRRHYHFPGIRIMQFGWSGLPQNIHHLRYVPEDCIYFTSGHDTNTVVGWWHHAKWYEHKHFREWAGRLPGPIQWQVISVVMHSRARLAMVAMQDLLGLGQEARLNRPGRVRGNWNWRMPRKALSLSLAGQLRRQTKAGRRI